MNFIEILTTAQGFYVALAVIMVGGAATIAIANRFIKSKGPKNLPEVQEVEKDESTPSPTVIDNSRLGL